MTARTQAIRELVEPVVAAAGFDLEDLVVRAAGKRRLVQVLADRDGGLGLDEAADLSRSISTVLDEANALGEQAYVLEVGSPGVDRPLTLPRHWQRNIGRLVRITPREAEPFVGRIRAVEADDVVLVVDEESRTLPIEQISKAVVQVEFTDKAIKDGEQED